jgi:1,4-dihydroxy-2-naphthoyl-CoA hydrolase
MPFTYQRTIRFQDTDAAGVVYFANILSMCHEAYEGSLEILGINIKEFFSHPSIAFPIVHANVDFYRPIYCGNKLVITLTTEKLSDEKFEINYQLSVSDILVSKAITRHVCIDTESQKKRELPTQMQQWVEANLILLG